MKIIFFGECILKPDDNEPNIAEVIDKNYLTANEDEIRAALKRGENIFFEDIDFECLYQEDHYSYVWAEIWKIMDKYADNNFSIIDDELSY